MRKYVLIATAIIFVSGVSLYFILGGNAAPVLTLENKPLQVVYGELFEGRPSEQRLEALSIDARERSKETGHELVVISYDQDQAPLKQFIGTLNGPKTSANLDAIEIPAGQYITAEIKAHNLVMPRPDDIKVLAGEFAGNKGLQPVLKVSYEVYKGDSSLTILFQCL
ncbi:MAG: hypothetical protein AAGG59_10705 [Bacteroidota bacterium]